MLDENTLLSAVEILSIRDPNFLEVINKHGPPPLWSRDQDFSTLVRTILEQQVSLASAQATYNKLLRKIYPITPKSFNSLTDQELRNLGFTRQKTKYCRTLAKALLNNEIDLDEIKEKSDSEAMDALTKFKGVGPWTASIYLMMALKRPDVWPEEDRALLIAMKEVKNLENIPSPKEAAIIAEEWKPWRSVAARILWHWYLSKRKKK